MKEVFVGGLGMAKKKIKHDQCNHGLIVYLIITATENYIREGERPAASMMGPGDQKASRPNPHRPLKRDIDTYLLRLSGKESGGSVSLMYNTVTYKTKNLSIYICTYSRLLHRRER